MQSLSQGVSFSLFYACVNFLYSICLVLCQLTTKEFAELDPSRWGVGVVVGGLGSSW